MGGSGTVPGINETGCDLNNLDVGICVQACTDQNSGISDTMTDPRMISKFPPVFETYTWQHINLEKEYAYYGCGLKNVVKAHKIVHIH